MLFVNLLSQTTFHNVITMQFCGLIFVLIEYPVSITNTSYKSKNAALLTLKVDVIFYLRHNQFKLKKQYISVCVCVWACLCGLWGHKFV